MKYVKLLELLRKNSRYKLTDLAFLLQKPVSTIFDWIRHSQKNYVKKFTAILNYKKLGYNLRRIIFLKSISDKIIDFFYSAKCINNVFKIKGDYNYLVDCIFKDKEEEKEFLLKIKEYSNQLQSHKVTDEILIENFMGAKNEKPLSGT